MADYQIYEDNLGQWSEIMSRVVKRVPGGAQAALATQVAAVAGPHIEDALRKELRGMTQKAVDNVCRRFHNLIGQAANHAYFLVTKHKVPKKKAVRMAVRAVLKVAYHPKYKHLWNIGKKRRAPAPPMTAAPAVMVK